MRTGIIAIALAAIVWSTGGVFIKLLSQDAYTILFYRALFAAALFAVVFGKKVFRISWRIVLVSFFYLGLVSCFVIATKKTTAANAIFLQYTAPVYLILLEPWLFRLKLRKINLITVVVCLLGMSLFFMGQFDTSNLMGNLIALGSGLFLAGLLLSQRFNPSEDHEAAIFLGNLLVALVYLPFAWNAPLPNPSEWGMLAFLGLIQIGLGYILFTYGLKRVHALESSLLGMLEPVLNPVWVLIGYGEKPTTYALLGGAVIVAMLIVRMVVMDREEKSVAESFK